MNKNKIVAVDKVQKLEYLTTGPEEYTIFYNDMVKKNNTIYDAYIENEKRIEYFEVLSVIDNEMGEILEKAYEIKANLINIHIKICNKIEEFEK